LIKKPRQLGHEGLKLKEEQSKTLRQFNEWLWYDKNDISIKEFNRISSLVLEYEKTLIKNPNNSDNTK